MAIPTFDLGILQRLAVPVNGARDKAVFSTASFVWANELRPSRGFGSLVAHFQL